jgi:alginate O-acetyltransferase complex protein AlgJ
MPNDSQIPQMNQGPAREAVITIALFFVAIWAPLLVGWAQEDRAISASENRHLASWPAFPSDREGAGAYAGALETYFSDHLGFRDGLMRSNARLWISALGGSPSPQVIVGKQGWFFFNDASAVAQYRGLARFSSSELERWKDVLVGRRDWLRERGIAYVLVLAPNKHMIYPEFMPDQLPRISTEEQHTQLAAYLTRHTDLEVVDLLPVLERAKREHRVYHLTDTHWNDVGAYQAYQSILAGVRRQIPQYADALDPIRVRVHRYTGDGIGLARMTGLSDVYREEMLALEKIDSQSEIKPEHRADYKARERRQKPLAHGTPDLEMPRGVMFRDSFANALIPYLSENFRRILYVWTPDIETGIVEREQPDVVIQQIAGRFLSRPPNAISARRDKH